MNRLEFNEVMKAVDINNPLSTTTGRYGSTEEVHYWGNLAIWFGGSYYTVVNGKIPYEVAKIIYEKYPGNPYEIRVDGGCVDWVPINYAVDEKYEKEIKELVDNYGFSKEYLTKCAYAYRNLKRRKDDSKYIKTYHIDSKEGLLIFLTEMKDYFARKKGLPETEVSKYDELISMVNREVLKKVNPSISAYDWMQDDVENKETYNLALERDSKTQIGQMFRQALDSFDKAVNPFLDENADLDDIHIYSSKVRIKANTSNESYGKYRQNCCSMEIQDLNTGSTTNYYRWSDGFSFQMFYVLGEGEYLQILHYFTTSGNFESDKGEVIAINYFGKNVKEEIDLRFNLTNGKAGKTYEDKTPATQEQLSFVYNELLKAINYATSITIDNMRKEKVKQLPSEND